MPFKTIDQVQEASKYAQTLKAELNRNLQRAKSYHYFENFSFKDGTEGPVVLVGKISDNLVKDVKKYGGQHKAKGKLQKDGSSVKYTLAWGSVTDEKLKQALRPADIQKVIQVDYLEGGDEEEEGEISTQPQSPGTNVTGLAQSPGAAPSGPAQSSGQTTEQTPGTRPPTRPWTTARAQQGQRGGLAIDQMRQALERAQKNIAQAKKNAPQAAAGIDLLVDQIHGFLEADDVTAAGQKIRELTTAIQKALDFSDTTERIKRTQALDKEIQRLRKLNAQACQPLDQPLRELIPLAGLQDKGPQWKAAYQTLVGQVETIRQTIGTAQLAQARQSVTDFQNNPGPHLARVQGKVRDATAAIVADIDAELDLSQSNPERVRKKRRFLPDTKDKRFHKEVTLPLREVLNRVKGALADPANTANVLTAIKETEDLIAALEKQRVYYADTSKIDPQDTAYHDQRERKVEAITGHQQDLRMMVDQLRNVLRLQMQPVVSVLESLPTLLNDAPGELKSAGKEIGDLLKDDTNPARRSALIQTLDAKTAAGFVLALESLNDADQAKVSNDIMTTHAGNPALLEQLALEGIRLEAENVRLVNPDPTNRMGSFFRSNTAGAVLPKHYVTRTAQGQQFLKRTAGQMYDQLKKIEESVEIDPAKAAQQKDKAAQQEDIARGLQEHRRMATALVKDFTRNPEAVPEDVARLAGEFYEQALQSSEGDEEFAITSVGGFLMLRLVVPLLYPGFSQTNDEEYKKGNQKVKARIEHQRRAAALQAKILQNMANGVELGGKEPYMQPLNDLVKLPSGEWAPQTAQLRNFMKEVALRGQISKNREKLENMKPTLPQVLAHPQARQIFREFLEKENSVAQLDFWLACQRNPTGTDAQKVFNEFVASNAPRKVNLGVSTTAGLHNCNQRGNWSNPPWGPVVQEMENQMDRDTWKRFQADPNRLNRLKLAMLK